MYISIYMEKEREELFYHITSLYIEIIPRFANSLSLRTGKD